MSFISVRAVESIVDPCFEIWYARFGVLKGSERASPPLWTGRVNSWVSSFVISPPISVGMNLSCNVLVKGSKNSSAVLRHVVGRII